MQCPKCGILASVKAERCPSCGLIFQTRTLVSALEGQSVVPAAVQYAGFWRRFGAFTIDSILLAAIWSSIVELLRVINFRATGVRAPPQDWMGLIYALSSFTSFLAPAIFESSRFQATPGKMISGIIVTNNHGGRIGFGRALARNFLKALSLLFLFPFIPIALPGKKRGLYDMMTGCLVVVKEPKQVVPVAQPTQQVQQTQSVTEVTALTAEFEKTADTQPKDNNWLFL